jgi:hypothetical protein
MPTDRPKVTVYLDELSYDALSSCAAALGQSRSRLLRELVESAVPVFEVMTDAALTLKLAKGKQREAFSTLADDLASKTVASNALLADVVQLLGRPKEKTPPSNTGVTST